MTNRDDRLQDMHQVRERQRADFPAMYHPGWAERLPWVVQGTTVRGDGMRPFDLGLFGDGTPVDEVHANWAALLRTTDASRVVHARQVHGATVRPYPRLQDVRETASAPASVGGDLPGLPSPPLLVEPCDGHATATPGALLAVATADCVPVFMVDRRLRAVASVHAGWRGVAAGVLEEALKVMEREWGTTPQDIALHLGPAICGACYEVGPEVFEALAQPVPAGPMPVDLRRVLAVRALEAGVPSRDVSISTHCTLCTGSGLFSHRGGDAGRQVGFLGIRTKDEAR